MAIIKTRKQSRQNKKSKTKSKHVSTKKRTMKHGGMRKKNSIKKMSMKKKTLKKRNRMMKGGARPEPPVKVKSVRGRGSGKRARVVLPPVIRHENRSGYQVVTPLGRELRPSISSVNPSRVNPLDTGSKEAISGENYAIPRSNSKVMHYTNPQPKHIITKNSPIVKTIWPTVLGPKPRVGHRIFGREQTRNAKRKWKEAEAKLIAEQSLQTNPMTTEDANIPVVLGLKQNPLYVVNNTFVSENYASVPNRSILGSSTEYSTLNPNTRKKPGEIPEGYMIMSQPKEESVYAMPNVADPVYENLPGVVKSNTSAPYSSFSQFATGTPRQTATPAPGSGVFTTPQRGLIEEADY